MWKNKKPIPQSLKNAVISRSDLEEFRNLLLDDQIANKVLREKSERAFQSLLAYEKNCIAKYDSPDNRPGKPPIKGERMSDYAERYGTTIEEMKSHWKSVEYALANGL